MNLHVSEFLLADMQSDPRYKAFGSRVAELGTRALHLDSQHLTTEASGIVDLLQRGIEDLLRSTGYKDTRGVEGVNERFKEDDMSTFDFETRDYRETEVGPDILPWLAHASLRDFTLFAIWNTARRNQLQARLNEEFDDRRDQALEDVERLVAAGIYPYQATKIYHDTLNRYGKFTAIDSFEAGLMGADGYCDDDTVAISNLYTRAEDMRGNSRNMRRTVVHEATHGVARNGGQHDRGFSLGIAQPHRYIHTLEEFWASKTEASVNFIEREQNGLPLSDLVVSMQLPTLDRSYPHLNTYYDTMAMISDKLKIPLIGHAYMSRRDSRRGQRLRQQLEKEITDITGEAEFFAMNDSYENLETTEERIDFMLSETAKIDPFTSFEPAVAGVGNVIIFKE